MTMWMASDAVPRETVDTTRAIVQTLGKEIYTDDEKMIDMATALSASGPAYVFLVHRVFDRRRSLLWVFRATSPGNLPYRPCLVAPSSIQDTGIHPAELKDMVTSPGGTTIEAHPGSFEEGRFRALVLNAVNAAYEKSQDPRFS